MTARLKMQYALVCDDVRREDSGKLILIGVYARDIRLTSVPATLVLSLVVNVMAPEPLEVDFEFQCIVDEVQKGSAKGHLKLTEAGASLFNIPRLVLPDIMGDTELSFQWRQNQSDPWETIYSIPIVAPQKKA